MDGPARALALCVEPDEDCLLIGAGHWPRSVDRRTPGLPPWPQGQFGTVALRLPKARDEFEMLAQAGAGALTPGGTLYLFGGKDEGIASAGRALAGTFERVETILTKFHARVLAARSPKAGLKSGLAAWRRTVTFSQGGTAFSHVTYPGVFASGRLDAGTEFLLDVLPAVGGTVLDFACGSGPIAQVLGRRHPEAAFTLADIDAIALAAARENVAGAPAHQIAKLADLPPAAFDAIVSNPPIHTGIAQNFAVLRDLLAAAPDHLARGGEIFLVAQRTVPVAKLAGALTARRLAENMSFIVWSLTR
ncbi:MAG: methyltransferase [Rhizomicrobium sp.]